MAISAVTPKRPTAPGWQRARWWRPPRAIAALGFPCEAYENREARLFVLSAVEVVPPKDGEPDLGPEYHLSVSAEGERCTTAEALWALAQFDAADAREDNHVPHGRVRHFWRPVADRLSGYECPCVEAEPAVVEDKGDFIWRTAPGMRA